MNPWFLLPVAALVFVAGAAASYLPRVRDSGWFPAVLVGSSVLSALAWVWTARLAATPRHLFSLGVAWDFTVLAAYTLVPLCLCGVRLSALSAAGLVLVLAGIVLVKVGEP